MDVSKWYWIVPTVILDDKNLSDKQLRLYIKISCLCATTWECWASNDYFASIYWTNKSTISKNLTALHKKGYIGIRLIYKEGTQGVDKRIITLTPTVDEILNGGAERDIGGDISTKQPIVNNGQDNNININNNINNNNNNNKQIAETIFTSYINNTTLPTKYQYPSKAKKQILSLLNKGVKQEHLEKSFKNYFAETDKKYRVTPFKFFNPNSHSWAYYEDFINTPEKKKIDVDNIDVGF